MHLLMDKICIITKIYHYIVNHELLPMSLLLLLHKLSTDPLIHLAMLINRPEVNALNRDPVASSIFMCTFFDLLLFPLLLLSSKAHTSPLMCRSYIGTLNVSIQMALNSLCATFLVRDVATIIPAVGKLRDGFCIGGDG